jgi:hypothetical protein
MNILPKIFSKMIEDHAFLVEHVEKTEDIELLFQLLPVSENLFWRASLWPHSFYDADETKTTEEMRKLYFKYISVMFNAPKNLLGSDRFVLLEFDYEIEFRKNTLIFFDKPVLSWSYQGAIFYVDTRSEEGKIQVTFPSYLPDDLQKVKDMQILDEAALCQIRLML